MNEAQQLLHLLRKRNMAINRFLDLAKFSRRDFYAWAQEDYPPTLRSRVKLKIALEILEEVS